MMIHTHADGIVWHGACLGASRRQNEGYPAVDATFWAEMDADLACDWCGESVSGNHRPWS